MWGVWAGTWRNMLFQVIEPGQSFEWPFNLFFKSGAVKICNANKAAQRERVHHIKVERRSVHKPSPLAFHLKSFRDWQIKNKQEWGKENDRRVNTHSLSGQNGNKIPFETTPPLPLKTSHLICPQWHKGASMRHLQSYHFTQSPADPLGPTTDPSAWVQGAEEKQWNG